MNISRYHQQTKRDMYADINTHTHPYSYTRKHTPSVSPATNSKQTNVAQDASRKPPNRSQTHLLLTLPSCNPGATLAQGQMLRKLRAKQALVQPMHNPIYNPPILSASSVLETPRINTLFSIHLCIFISLFIPLLIHISYAV